VSLRYLIIALIVVGGASPASAETHQHEMRVKQCRYQWVDPGMWTAKEERRTARCVVDRWGVPGGLGSFDRIIGCESGWSRLAYNPSGPYVGLGQHALGSWPGRVAAYSPPLWNLNPSWRNSRTMLTITARMAHSMGWGAWSCA